MAQRLAKRAELDVEVSLAGRTRSPTPQGARLRSGGFGGVSGLADYLVTNRIEALIDATHPYADVISANAAAAARQTAVPLVALRRGPWRAVDGDRWQEVEDVGAAVRALADRPRRILITLGRSELGALTEAPQHFYLIRSIDPVEPPLPLPRAAFVTARGPFGEADDRALMQRHEIDTVIAKNSGGAASYGKIAAARALGVEVIMLRRPPLADAPAVETVEAAIAWLDHALTSAVVRGV